jgi:GntR family transcriptional repressor for pyruvate dehydrogenase complex
MMILSSNIAASSSFGQTKVARLGYSNSATAAMQHASPSSAPSRVDEVVALLQPQLRVGERLPSERSLSQRFGVGRTTIREALKSLAVQGYLVRTPRGAVPIERQGSPTNVEELETVAARASVRDLYEVRKLLEVRIAHWAALRATPDDISALEKMLRSEEDAGPRARQSHAGLHDTLASATHNPVLVQLYETNRGLLFRLPFFWNLLDQDEIRAARARRHSLAHVWHRRVVAAVVEHDPDEAAAAMFRHLDEMEQDLFSQLQSAP